MSNIFKIFCVFILLAVSIIPSFSQSSAIPANNQSVTNPAEPDSAKTDLLRSELASAPLAPCTIVGTTSGNFSNLIEVTVTGPSLVGSPTIASITWGSGTCTTASTCTIIFQNPPPGAAQVALSDHNVGPAPDDIPSTGWIDVFASPLVIFKDDSAAAGWFPAGVSPNTTLTYMWLRTAGQWYSSEDKEKASGYPSLQWQPGTVTIIYQ